MDLFEDTSTMDKVRDLMARGALFVVNHSGGKDSQAMYLHLRSPTAHREAETAKAHRG